MKTLGHILIILFAAFVVIGAIYALSQTTAVSTLVGQPLGGGETEDRPALSDFAAGQGGLPGEASVRPAGGPEGRGGSWETVWRNLLEMAAIVAVVQVLWSIGRRLKPMSTSPARNNRFHPGRST